MSDTEEDLLVEVNDCKDAAIVQLAAEKRGANDPGAVKDITDFIAACEVLQRRYGAK